eukprot:3001088-Amphidinium_carterae.1
MLEQPSEYLLTRLFWDQVKNCREFEFIFQQYENSDETSYKRSCKWLREEMDKALERRRTESNLRQGIKHFRDGQPRSPSPIAPFQSPSHRQGSRFLVEVQVDNEGHQEVEEMDEEL